ncbi:MAG: phage tail protein, partial [Lactobacillus crispatus]|nr:phage tail protein [Lactobacillus crispatus]MCT7878512.1 phage tail protein [Lactobacillus crispatus]
ADTDNSADTDTNYNANVDQSNKEVTVKIGPLYAEGFGVNPNIDSVNTVDISGYFKHDDQDLSGQQSDGSFV